MRASLLVPAMIGLAFVLSADVLLLVPIGPANPDPWFGPDKLKHLMLSACAVFLVARSPVCLVAILLGGLGKELIEALDIIPGTASMRDMVANLVGVCYGAVIHALVMER